MHLKLVPSRALAASIENRTFPWSEVPARGQEKTRGEPPLWESSVRETRAYDPTSLSPEGNFTFIGGREESSGPFTNFGRTNPEFVVRSVYVERARRTKKTAWFDAHLYVLFFLFKTIVLREINVLYGRKEALNRTSRV